MPAASDAPNRSILGLLYGLYAWIAFLICALFAILAVILLPGLERRRRAAAFAARTSFMLAGVSTSVTGLDNLPDGHCIVVANHASYVDGVILQAFLPPRFAYVIKGEMQNIPVVHFLLRRIGSRFVERFVASGSTRDARALLKAAADGESLAFFPEGTFVAEAGLRRFRLGAFAAAVKGDLPVVPVVIRGSRRLLPSDAFLPTRGPLRVDVLAPLATPESDHVSSKDLAALARQRILTVLDEPDLGQIDAA